MNKSLLDQPVISGASLLGLTVLTLIAFAANSVLGRFALLGEQSGAGGFALIRLISGAVMLVLLCRGRGLWGYGHWSGGVALFVYAAFFSYAYLTMDTGAGALILFSVVQIVMVGAGLFRGGRLRGMQAAGLAAAIFGLLWWLFPRAGAPPLLGSTLMIVSGVGWASYSLMGLTGTDATKRTAGNFLRAAVIAAVALPPVMVLTAEPLPTMSGVSLAVASGAITSGLGYALWYMILPALGPFRAAFCQLTVPVLAAIGGIIFTADNVTATFIAASVLILSGVAVATLQRSDP